MYVTVPMLTKGFEPAYKPQNVLGQRDRLMQLYGPFVRQACELNGVPEWLLTGIVLIENYQLRADSVNRAPGRPQYREATGLGQHMMYSATDIISRAVRKRLLTEPKREVLRRRLGSRLAYIEKNIGTTEYVVTQADLKDAEFNLMLTGMYLSQLLGEHKQGDTWELDKVAVRYNQGYYFKLPKHTGTNDLIAKLSREPRSYLLKLVGAGGLLEILT